MSALPLSVRVLVRLPARLAPRGERVPKGTLDSRLRMRRPNYSCWLSYYRACSCAPGCKGNCGSDSQRCGTGDVETGAARGLVGPAQYNRAVASNVRTRAFVVLE